MTLRQMAYFVKVAELGSLSKAANALRIAQPALSRQMQALEAELGVSLLERHSWGISATEAGNQFLKEAKRILADISDTRATISAMGSGMTGRLSIGMPPLISAILRDRLLSTIKTAQPNLHVRFVEGYSTQLADLVRSEKVDIAVMYSDGVDELLEKEELFTEDVLYLGPSGKKLKPRVSIPDMIRSDTLILSVKWKRIRSDVTTMLEHAGMPLPHIIDVETSNEALKLAASGKGCTILPYSSANGEIQQSKLTAWKISRPEMQKTLLVSRSAARPKTAAQLAVTRHIRSLASTTLSPNLAA